MRCKLVAGNWKLHGSNAMLGRLLDELKAAEKAFTDIQLAVCPPFVYLPQAEERLVGSSIALGAQNVCQYIQGAYTGEVSAAMLADIGCRYVIVGHSERRQLFGETDAVVAAKVAIAQNAELIPIVCVGELLQERERGETEAVIARQLNAVLAEVGPQALQRAVIAYEPVWAIGTGKSASPEQAQAVHAFIRGLFTGADKVQILYGGSVKANNAAALFAQPDIDGGLIGGAALQAAEFLAICRAAHA